MKDLKTDLDKVLLIGIGNSGRGDDGLGWRFAELVQRLDYNFLDYEFRYQLQIEDTVHICRYGTVIFVDASHDVLKDGFEMNTCQPANHYFYSSHIQSPETILYLVNDLYNKFPKAYTLVISGSYWDLKTSLSDEAEKNLRSAFEFFIEGFLTTNQLKPSVNKDQLST